MLPDVEEGRTARITRGVAQILFDAQELVVLGDAIGARQRAGLDLSAISESSVSPERCDMIAV